MAKRKKKKRSTIKKKLRRMKEHAKLAEKKANRRP